MFPRYLRVIGRSAKSTWGRRCFVAPPPLPPVPTPPPHGRSTWLHAAIASFNENASNYPQTALYTFLLSRMGTWYLLTAIYAQTATVGPELAIGYLVAKVTGKVRQPANVALAAVISHRFPIFSEVKASALLGVVHPGPAAAATAGNEEAPPPPPPSALEKRLLQVLEWLRGPVDKYGFSLFIAGKVNIGLTILLTGTALRNGVDVSSFLTSWGVTDSMQNGAGAMALATLTNIVLLPGHLALLPVVIPAIGPRMQAAMTDAMDKIKAADDAWEKKSSGKGGENDREK